MSLTICRPSVVVIRTIAGLLAATQTKGRRATSIYYFQLIFVHTKRFFNCFRVLERCVLHLVHPGTKVYSCKMKDSEISETFCFDFTVFLFPFSGFRISDFHFSVLLSFTGTCAVAYSSIVCRERHVTF